MIDSSRIQRPYRVAFILAPHRSGSTLLDNLLASHPSVISVGEVDKLRAYALNDRRLYDPDQPLVCSCGEPVGSCRFWTRVEQALGRSFTDLSLQWPFVRYGRESLPFLQRLQQRLGLIALKRRPGLFRSTSVQRALSDGRQITDNWQLFDAIHAASRAPCIVDASKGTYRFRLLRERNAEFVRAVVLCRDYRAVTYSLMRRGLSLEEGIAKWRLGIRLIEEMVRDLPPDQVMRLTYEELCLDSRTTVRNVWAFLGLPTADTPEMRSLSGMHHISGSPSKVDPQRQTICHDDSFLGAFNRSQLQYLERQARPYSMQWGYS
jgi:hypothetical protein